MTTISKKIIGAAVAAALGLSLGAQAAEQQSVQESAPAASQARPIDRIVAIVNNGVITEFELQNRVHSVALNLRQQNIELPSMQALRAQVLERMITEKAMEQRARELGIRVDEQMVSASIEQIARNNRMTVDDLRARLSADGMSFGAFRKQVREEIVAQRLREREVDSKITIPESEVDAYLIEKTGFTGSDTHEYHIQHILIPLPADNEDGVRAAEKLQEELAERARKGEDFGKLAAAYSKAEDALSGGDLGWRDSTRMPSVFWQAISENAKKGTVATARSQQALHVIKVLGDRDGVHAKLTGMPIEQSHVRHILMTVSEMDSEGAIVSRLNEIKAKVEAGQGDFATYARLNSADSTATRGGDLGWISAGDTVPEFESAVSALKPGQISAPVKTQFGYHLIQVVERRSQAPDINRARFAARQALREKKLAQAVQDWQRELHDRAYVDIRHDNL